MNSAQPNSDVDLRRCENQPDLAARAARALVALVAELQTSGDTVSDDGYVRLVLTGGGAGIALLRELAQLDHAATMAAEDFPVAHRIDWTRVHVFFGDERFVPSGHPERNDGQAFEALLNHVDIPEENLHRYPTPRDGEDPKGPQLDAAADEYARVIDTVAPQGFDVHLLGMGPEGHINSLFPHTPELQDNQHQVVPVRDCPKPPPERISLTLPAINSASHVWLLVSGAAKKQAAGEVLRRGDCAQWPAAGVRGTQSTVLWVDRESDPSV